METQRQVRTLEKLYSNAVNINPSTTVIMVFIKEKNPCNDSTIIPRAVTKALIGGGGIFIYSRSAQRISFEISCHYS